MGVVRSRELGPQRPLDGTSAGVPTPTRQHEPTGRLRYPAPVDASDVIAIADRIGIVAFAFSGVEVGVRKRFDIFGLLVIGVVTATGGGLMRDVVLGRLPYVLDRPDYLLVAAGASLASIPLVTRRGRSLNVGLAAADAVGLGAFAVAGAAAGLRADLAVPAVVVLAMLTATGGGILRDLLADRVPLVLRAEVNATAAAVGGFTSWALDPWSTGGGALIGAVVAAGLRLGSLALHVNLPVPGRETSADHSPVGKQPGLTLEADDDERNAG